MNLLHRLYDARRPESAAFHLPGGTVVTTQELCAWIGRYAAALERLGVRAGDRVSFKLEKRIEVVYLAHACLQLGAIVHPLNTAYTDEEIEYLLTDAAPALLVCESDELSRFHAMAVRRRVFLSALSDGHSDGLVAAAARERGVSALAQVGPDDTAAILYTSGTTGRPKGAKITHRNLAQSASALCGVWELGPTDVLLHALPLYHAHGLLTAINTMLVAGGSTLFLPRFEPCEVLTALPQASLMMGVPTHYTRLLREPGFGDAFSPQFRFAISGSAPLAVTTSARFEEITGRPLIERYGSTEAAIVTAIPPGASRSAGWVGWPLAGVEVRVANERGRFARGEIGELETRGHNVFAGYWNRPESDRQAFTADGWFMTGDVAEIRADGCVRLVDRAKDLVISGGLNVYPREVEAVLDALPGVAQSAVFGVPHPDFGEAVAAVVELESGAVFDEAAMIARARSRLAAYKVPKRILAMENIPRNRMSKVLKNTLRAAHQQLFQSASSMAGQP